MAEQWPVFICYRQSDGMPTARRLYEMLRNLRLPIIDTGLEHQDPPELDVYFDQVAPGVDDWKSVHEPYLKRSRAMIVVCTPGARLIEGDGDWVHTEINWWMANRDIAPILVDPLGETSRYVPDAILRKWPDSQRIRIIEHDWLKFDEAELAAARERATAQLVGGIVPSGQNFFRLEFENEQKRVADLNAALARQQVTSRRLVGAIGAMGLLLISAVAAVAFAFIKTGEAQTAQVAAETALEEVRTSTLQNRVLSAQRNLSSGDFTSAIEIAASLRQEAALPDSPIAANAHEIDTVIVDAANNLVVATVCRGNPRSIDSLQIAPDGATMVAAMKDDSIARWTLSDCASATTLFQHEDKIAGLVFSPSSHLASASWDRVLRLESSDRVDVAKLVSGRGRVIHLAFSKSDGLLALSTNRNEVFTAAPGTAANTLVETLVQLPSGATSMGLVGDTILGNKGGAPAFFDLSGAIVSGPFRLDATQIKFAAAVPGGSLFALAQEDNSVWLVGPETQARALGKLRDDIKGISVSADASSVIGFDDNELAVFPLEAGGKQRTFRPFPDDIESAQAVSAGLLAAVSDSGVVRLIGTTRGETVWQDTSDQYSDLALAVSEDGTHLAYPIDEVGLSVRRLLNNADDALAYYCSTVAVASTGTSAICTPQDALLSPTAQK